MVTGPALCFYCSELDMVLYELQLILHISKQVCTRYGICWADSAIDMGPRTTFFEEMVSRASQACLRGEGSVNFAHLVKRRKGSYARSLKISSSTSSNARTISSSRGSSFSNAVDTLREAKCRRTPQSQTRRSGVNAIERQDQRY